MLGKGPGIPADMVFLDLEDAVQSDAKADARAVRHGFPWVYANELVTDRRTKAIPAGGVAVLEDAERRPMGLVAVNPASKIICRMLDADPAAVIDKAWFAGRIARALAHRERLYAEPFYRLIHAEADGLPGVVIDRFGDVAVVQPNAAWADARIDDLGAALAEVTGVSTIIMNGTGRARGLEGLPEETRLLMGKAPTAPIPVPMNGATYMADVMGGQKTGLFYDQRPNHAFAARLARDAAVLDVFSHVGGFSLAALASLEASFARTSPITSPVVLMNATTRTFARFSAVKTAASSVISTSRPWALNCCASRALPSGIESL